MEPRTKVAREELPATVLEAIAKAQPHHTNGVVSLPREVIERIRNAAPTDLSKRRT